MAARIPWSGAPARLGRRLRLVTTALVAVTLALEEGALALFGLAEQGAGRLLEDAPPGTRLLAFLSEAFDDTAHARRGDLDAVTGADRAEVVVVLRELDRDRFEAVASDLDALRVIHDVRREHQLVVRVGLDQH